MPHWYQLIGLLLISSTQIAAADRNQQVLTLIEGYPVGGGYLWPGRRGTHGTFRTIRHRGIAIATKGQGSHCVGITFEVMWRALRASQRKRLSVRQTERLRYLWFVPKPGGKGAAAALPRYRLGKRIDAANAKPGDFVQIWNSEQTFGHSAVFLGWQRDKGKIIGLRYWSSQPWTNGIGTAVMTVGAGSGIPLANVYFARIEP